MIITKILYIIYNFIFLFSLSCTFFTFHFHISKFIVFILKEYWIKIMYGKKHIFSAYNNSLIPSAVMPQIPFNWIMKLASDFNIKLKIRRVKVILEKVHIYFDRWDIILFFNYYERGYECLISIQLMQKEKKI